MLQNGGRLSPNIELPCWKLLSFVFRYHMPLQLIMNCSSDLVLVKKEVH